MKRVPRLKQNCLQCNGDVFVTEREKNNGEGKYCSRVCKDIFQIGKPSLRIGMKQPSTAGEGNPRWNGGRSIHSAGYILVKRPNHPFATYNGYVREHRLVMEKHIGRYLLPGEDVYHLDDDKTNNSITNLELFASRSEHFKKYHRDSGKATWFKKGINRSIKYATSEL